MHCESDLSAKTPRGRSEAESRDPGATALRRPLVPDSLCEASRMTLILGLSFEAFDRPIEPEPYPAKNRAKPLSVTRVRAAR